MDANRKEELFKLTVKELRDVAKAKGISGRWTMTKDQLVEAIVSSEGKDDVEQTVETEQVKDTEDAVAKEEKETTTESNKQSYLETAKAGTIIAFKLGNGYKSAMIEKRSTSKKVFKVRTRVGEEFLVPFNDVIWVKTGKRWPKGVLNALKGVPNA